MVWDSSMPANPLRFAALLRGPRVVKCGSPCTQIHGFHATPLRTMGIPSGSPRSQPQSLSLRLSTHAPSVGLPLPATQSPSLCTVRLPRVPGSCLRIWLVPLNSRV